MASSISLDDPVCVILASEPHFWEPARAREIVGSYLSRMAPGSAVVISCLRSDDSVLFGQASESYTAAGVYNFTREEMESLFSGLEPVPPGIALARGWRGGVATVPHKPAGAAHVLGGVGLKR